jgi:hypothetical protein
MRLLTFVLIYFLLLTFLKAHARKVEKPLPAATAENAFVSDPKMEKGIVAFTVPLGIGIAAIFCSSFIPALQDYAMIIVAVAFLVAGTAACFTSGMGGKRYGKTFAQGSFTITKAAQRITVKTASVSQEYQKNKTFTLEAKSSGDGALKYKSSDDSVLSVNKKGVCTMHKPGVVTLTVKAAETEHYKAAKGVVEVTIYKRAKKLSYSRSYMSGKYYKALKKLKLTGTTGVNAADIALSQLGYKEGRKSGQMAGNGRGIGNWTEYGRYYGLNHQPWCAMFVNWCAREAGASYSAVPKYAACRYYHSYFKRQGRFHSWKKVRSGSYKPKKGDIILYAYSKGGVAHHIGYVLDVSYEDGKVKVTTVEGNTNDAVRVVSVSYSATGSGKHGSHYILGMANPKW